MQSGVYFSFMYYEVWEYEFVPLEIVQGDTHLSSIVRSIVTAFEKGMELASQLRKDIPNTGPLCWGSARGTERICCQPTGRQQRRKPVRGVMDRLGRILDDAKANGDVDEQALILFLQLSNTVIRRIWRRNNKELTISRFCEERGMSLPDFLLRKPHQKLDVCFRFYGIISSFPSSIEKWLM